MPQGEGRDEDLAAQLQRDLQKLKGLETMVQGVLQKFTDLESTMKSIKGEIAILGDRTNAVEKSFREMDNGLKFMNTEVEDLKSKVNENEREIKPELNLNHGILYQDVYGQRENLRFCLSEPINIAKKSTREVISRY